MRETSPNLPLAAAAEALRRRIWVVVGALVIGGGVSLFMALTATRQYSSTCTVRIDVGSKATAAVPGLPAVLGYADPLLTEIEIIRSRAVAAGVVKSLGRYFVETGRKGAEGAWLVVDKAPPGLNSLELTALFTDTGRFTLDDRDRSYGEYTTGQTIKAGGFAFRLEGAAGAGDRIQFKLLDREEALDLLQSKVDVEVVPPTELVAITVTDPDPAMAALYANTIAESYREYSAGQSYIKGRQLSRFIAGQMDSIQLALDSLGAELAAYREREGIYDLGQQASAAVGQLAKMDAERMETEIYRKQIESQYPGLSTEGEPFLGDTTTYDIAELTLLKTELAQLSAVYRDDHPRLVALKEIIEEAERDIAKTQTARLDAAATVLAKRAWKLERELDGLPGKAVGLAKLTRDVEALRAVYEHLVITRSEAGLMQAKEIGLVTVVDQALPPRKPSRPKRKIILLIGLALGLMAGLAGAFAMEVVDKRALSPLRIDRLVGAPAVRGLGGEVVAAAEGSGSRLLLLQAAGAVDLTKCARSLIETYRATGRSCAALLSPWPSEGPGELPAIESIVEGDIVPREALSFGRTEQERKELYRKLLDEMLERYDRVVVAAESAGGLPSSDGLKLGAPVVLVADRNAKLGQIARAVEMCHKSECQLLMVSVV